MTREEFWELTENGDFRIVRWENPRFEASGIVVGTVRDDLWSTGHVSLADEGGKVQFVSYQYIVSVV